MFQSLLTSKKIYLSRLEISCLLVFLLCNKKTLVSNAKRKELRVCFFVVKKESAVYYLSSKWEMSVLKIRIINIQSNVFCHSLVWVLCLHNKISSFKKFCHEPQNPTQLMTKDITLNFDNLYFQHWRFLFAW